MDMESIDKKNDYQTIKDEILTMVKIDQEMRKTNIVEPLAEYKKHLEEKYN